METFEEVTYQERMAISARHETPERDERARRQHAHGDGGYRCMRNALDNRSQVVEKRALREMNAEQLRRSGRPR